VFDLPGWGYLAGALALARVTIFAVTVFLHRHQAHRALELHPAASHFFRLWLWLTTGMRTREWVAVHQAPRALRDCRRSAQPGDPGNQPPMATQEQLVGRLQDWCQRAEASGIVPLAEFSRRLRSYA
jgi:hypothetical protein